ISVLPRRRCHGKSRGHCHRVADEAPCSILRHADEEQLLGGLLGISGLDSPTHRSRPGWAGPLGRHRPRVS
ncbi:unnamed protein product, partial [Symbiodinium microadriaticum]